MYFLQYLTTKSKDSFNGAESYVWRKFQAKDFRWIPSDKCWAIQAQTRSITEEQTEKHVTKRDMSEVGHKVGAVEQRLEHMESKFDSISKKIEQLVAAQTGAHRVGSSAHIHEMRGGEGGYLSD